jgi:hypothetical protein
MDHEKQIEILEHHLTAKGVDRTCSACKKHEMRLFDYPFSVPIQGSSEIADFFAMMCPSCCHTMFFSMRSPKLLKKWAEHPEGWLEKGGRLPEEVL